MTTEPAIRFPAAMNSRGVPVTSSVSRSGSIWPPRFLFSFALGDNLGIGATFIGTRPGGRGLCKCPEAQDIGASSIGIDLWFVLITAHLQPD